MFVHIWTFMYAYTHPVADVTGATKVQGILKSGLDSLQPVPYAWRGQVSPAGRSI